MSHPTTTDPHPRPSVIEAIERSKMRRPASDATQRAIWIGFFVLLAALLGTGLVLGLQHSQADPPTQPSTR